MASKRFLDVHKLTAEFEGGWSNHPADPGGKTMYGVTERVYHAWLKSKGRPHKSIRQITMAEAHELYFENYWLAAGCDKLARGVDRMVYDAAVNSGVSRARKWLLSSIGGSDRQTVQRMSSTRLAFLKGLKTWPTFGRGWERRVNAMTKAALAEVGQPAVAPQVPDTFFDIDQVGREVETAIRAERDAKPAFPLGKAILVVAIIIIAIAAIVKG